MRKTRPDIPTIEFLADVWGRLNEDVSGAIYGGIRRVLSFFGCNNTRRELRRVVPEQTSDRRTFRCETSTREIKSRQGCRRSILLSELKGGPRRQESHAAFGRYLSRRRPGRNRTDGIDFSMGNEEVATAPPKPTGLPDQSPARKTRIRPSGLSSPGECHRLRVIDLWLIHLWSSTAHQSVGILTPR